MRGLGFRAIYGYSTQGHIGAIRGNTRVMEKNKETTVCCIGFRVLGWAIVDIRLTKGPYVLEIGLPLVVWHGISPNRNPRPFIRLWKY